MKRKFIALCKRWRLRIWDNAFSYFMLENNKKLVFKYKKFQHQKSNNQEENNAKEQTIY